MIIKPAPRSRLQRDFIDWLHGMPIFDLDDVEATAHAYGLSPRCAAALVDAVSDVQNVNLGESLVLPLGDGRWAGRYIAQYLLDTRSLAVDMAVENCCDATANRHIDAIDSVMDQVRVAYPVATRRYEDQARCLNAAAYENM